MDWKSETLTILLINNLFKQQKKFLLKNTNDYINIIPLQQLIISFLKNYFSPFSCIYIQIGDVLL